MSKAASPSIAAGKAHNRDLLMVSISRFYTNKGMVQKILPIVNGASRVSLRLIDWFVTNYAKRHNVVLVHVVDGHPLHFNVYTSYRAQLKAYSKQQFDPFRRRDRIDFYYDREKCVETTIGQLNFFRWMLQNQLVEYVDEHFEDIEAEMLRACPPLLSAPSDDFDARDARPPPALDMTSSSKPSALRTLSHAKPKPQPCAREVRRSNVNAATPPRTILFD